MSTRIRERSSKKERIKLLKIKWYFQSGYCTFGIFKVEFDWENLLYQQDRSQMLHNSVNNEMAAIFSNLFPIELLLIKFIKDGNNLILSTI